MVLDKLNYLVESIIQDLIVYLAEDKKISKEEAMDIVYNSKTSKKLHDLSTHLYYESSSYIYEMLKEEMDENA